MSIREQLATALRALPAPEGHDPGDHEALVWREAGYLGRLARWQGDDPGASAKRLVRLAVALEWAATEAAALDEDDALALYRAGVLGADDEPDALLRDLQARAAAVRRAAAAVRQQPPMRGQVGKARARAVAIRAARAFEVLTGKPPGRSVNGMTHAESGAFVDLVRCVFELFEIEASAEHMAREAIATVMVRPAAEKS